MNSARRLARIVARLKVDPLLSESLMFGGSTVAEQLSRLVTGLVAAALLGPAVWGQWYLLNLVLQYGSVVHLGAINGMNREIPALLGAGDKAGAARLQRSALGAVIAAYTATGALLLIASGIGASSGADARWDGWLRLLGLTLFLSATHQVFAYTLTALRSRTQFGAVSRLQFASVIVHPLLALPLAWQFGLTGFIVGQALAYLTLTLLSVTADRDMYRIGLDRQDVRRLVRVGFPIMTVGIVHTLFSTADRWIISAKLGSEALGHYSIAIMALGGVRIVSRVFSQQFYPRMSYSWGRSQDTDELRALAARQARLALVGVSVSAGLLFILAPWIVRSFLPAYIPGIAPLLVTLLVPLVAILGQGYGNVLNVVDRQYVYLWLIGLGTVVNVVASLWLVGSMGLVGVALGTMAGFAALAVGLFVAGRRTLNLLARRPQL